MRLTLPSCTAAPDVVNRGAWPGGKRHHAKQPMLRARGVMTRAMRDFFLVRGFEEVETAVLQISPGAETHIRGFATDLITPSGARSRLHLHASPEFACKTLIAAGETAIFTLAHVFRNAERGPLHHPEFTMLEWYRAGAPYRALMEDCADLVRCCALAAGARALAYRDRRCDPFATVERLSVAEAFARYAAIDLAAALEDRDRLAHEAAVHGLRVSHDDSWSDLFSKIMTACIEPRLGLGGLTILDAYPLSEAALAQAQPDDPRWAERFELYACGVELANAFGELTDAAEQRRRFEAQQADQLRIYGEAAPLDEDFLAALASMPPTSGIALGFDRLVMLATGAARIDDVLWTPVFDPEAGC